MKGIITSLNLFILIAIIFFLLGLMLAIFAFGGMAIAVPFFSKLLIVLSIICFLLSIAFYFLKKKVRIKIEENKKK